MTPDQFLKTLHHHWSESDWPVVIEAGYVVFLGQGDYGGGLETGWDSGLAQGLVENPGEDSSQLVCAVLQDAPWDAVRSSRLPGVDSPQRAPHLMLFHCER